MKLDSFEILELALIIALGTATALMIKIYNLI